MKKPSQSIRARVTLVLRQARTKLGMNQSEFSTHLGFSQGWISKVENGKHVPSLEDWFLICEKVKIESSVLSLPEKEFKKKFATASSSKSSAGKISPEKPLPPKPSLTVRSNKDPAPETS